LSKEIGDKNEIAVAYGNIGNMCNNKGDYPEALKKLSYHNANVS
jgi:hypothetical protein